MVFEHETGRHRDDAEVNRRLAEVIRGGRVEEEMWRDLRVGDIVWIKKGGEVPADIVQLASSEEVRCNRVGDSTE